MPARAKQPDDLYGLPREDFVAARTALSKEMRAAGNREQARELAALRRPSVAAWAVNQLVRSQSRAITKLFKAGDELQRIQSELLAGQASRERLAQAVAEEREAVDALVERARGLLNAEGQELSASTLDRVAATLHAAALEDDARSVVQAGRLERELEHVGLGAASLPAASPSRPGQKRDRSRAGPAAAEKRAERERTERLKTARRAEARARRAAERAQGDLGRAQKRQRQAEQALEEARAEVETQQQRTERARAEQNSAEQALHQAEKTG